MLTSFTASETERVPGAFRSWAKNRPNGELATAPITMIMITATNRTLPPTRLIRELTKADTARTTAAESFFVRAKTPLPAFRIVWMFCRLRYCLAGSAAIRGTDGAGGTAVRISVPDLAPPRKPGLVLNLWWVCLPGAPPCLGAVPFRAS